MKFTKQLHWGYVPRAFVTTALHFRFPGWELTNTSKNCTARNKVTFLGSYWELGYGSIDSLPSCTGHPDLVDQTRLVDWGTEPNKVIICSQSNISRIFVVSKHHVLLVMKNVECSTYFFRFCHFPYSGTSWRSQAPSAQRRHLRQTQKSWS